MCNTASLLEFSSIGSLSGEQATGDKLTYASMRDMRKSAVPAVRSAMEISRLLGLNLRIVSVVDKSPFITKACITLSPSGPSGFVSL